jgi:hypothetical protein
MASKRKRGMKVNLLDGTTTLIYQASHKLKQLCGDLYFCPIGYLTLKKLGYGVGFYRPKGRRSEVERCKRYLVRLGSSTRRIVKDIRGGMKRGVCRDIPRGYKTKAIFRALPRTGYNVKLRKQTFTVYALYLLDEVGDVADVKVINNIEAGHLQEHREQELGFLKYEGIDWEYYGDNYRGQPVFTLFRHKQVYDDREDMRYSAQIHGKSGAVQVCNIADIAGITLHSRVYLDIKLGDGEKK